MNDTTARDPKQCGFAHNQSIVNGFVVIRRGRISEEQQNHIQNSQNGNILNDQSSLKLN